jgi:aryl-alcohol dehydrogenase-like predicted oxidoreductase
MAMMAYAVLGRGMLSDQVPKVEELAAHDVRQRLPRFQNVNIEKNLGLRSALEAIARRKNATLAQLSIAWPMAQGKRAGVFIVPIPGAKSRKHIHKHIQENVRAANIVRALSARPPLARRNLGVQTRNICRRARAPTGRSRNQEAQI